VLFLVQITVAALVLGLGYATLIVALSTASYAVLFFDNVSVTVLARVGEPFFTTKAPGAGIGLGVFLARAFADRLGGHLTLAPRQGRGTQAVLEIPDPGA
jgi:C4-dicarboxylate-specific signal transduction histidine kinase